MKNEKFSYKADDRDEEYEEEEEQRPGQKQRKKRKHVPLPNAVRCPDCFVRIRFSEDEIPDEVIADHLRFYCDWQKPVVENLVEV